MKKFIIFAIALVTTFWLLAANKFEKYVENALPEDLEKISSIVKVDPATIEVNKYTFSLKTGEAWFFKDSPFYQVKAEGLKVCYNPFTQSITLKVTGTKEFIKVGKAEVYIENPSEKITFNRSLLKEGLGNLHITFATNNESKIRAASDDSELMKFGSARMIVTGKDSEIEGNYKLRVDLNVEKEKLYDSTKLITMIMGKMTSGSPKEIEIVKTLSEMFGDYNKKLSCSIDMKKILFHKARTLANEESDVNEVMKDLIAAFNPLDDKYSLNIQYLTDSLESKSDFKLAIGNDGDKISAVYDFGASTNYSEAQKSSLASGIGSLYYEAIKNDPKNKIFNMDKLSENDYALIATKLLDINSLNGHFKVDYEKESNDFDGKVSLALNNKEISVEGKGINKEKTVNAVVKATDPGVIINNVVQFAEEAIYPLADKIAEADDKEVRELKHFIGNVKNNGFAALAVLNKEADLKAGDHFTADIYIDLNGFKFKVNDKNFLEIITDKRIEKFLEEMSQTHRKPE